jgi:hypothetical protein
MAVDYIGVRFALAAPHPCTRNAAAKQNLVEALTKLREAEAIMVIESDSARPVNSEMGNQGKAD